MKCCGVNPVVQNYKQLLAIMERQNIDALKLGFIHNVCNPMLFSILIHCMENIEIFNDTQLRNINSFVNKISYGI